MNKMLSGVWVCKSLFLLYWVSFSSMLGLFFFYIGSLLLL